VFKHPHAVFKDLDLVLQQGGGRRGVPSDMPGAREPVAHQHAKDKDNQGKEPNHNLVGDGWQGVQYPLRQ